jgi:hypothetical protein
MKTVTIAGCVQRVPSVPVGTSGVNGRSSRPNFLLTNAYSRIGGTGATHVSRSTVPTATVYRLGNGDRRLEGRVGQKVEVTGTVDQSAWTTTSDLDLHQASAMDLVPWMTVLSVKTVASSCP